MVLLTVVVVLIFDVDLVEETVPRKEELVGC